MHLLVRTIPISPSPFHLRRTRACFVCRSQSRFLQSERKEQLEPELMPNARRRKHDPHWEGDGSSLGVDLGNVRTGLAVGTSLGFSRPLTVLFLFFFFWLSIAFRLSRLPFTCLNSYDFLFKQPIKHVLLGLMCFTFLWHIVRLFILGSKVGFVLGSEDEGTGAWGQTCRDCRGRGWL